MMVATFSSARSRSVIAFSSVAAMRRSNGLRLERPILGNGPADPYEQHHEGHYPFRRCRLPSPRALAEPARRACESTRGGAAVAAGPVTADGTATSLLRRLPTGSHPSSRESATRTWYRVVPAQPGCHATIATSV